MVRDLVGNVDCGIDSVEEIDDIYDEIDVDHSGCINFREIHRALRPVVGRRMGMALNSRNITMSVLDKAFMMNLDKAVMNLDIALGGA